MTGFFLPLLTLFLSLVILLTGHGVQLTVVPLYGVELGWSERVIGYLGSAYFLGFILGCLTVPRLVASVGHIRVFGVLTSAATAALLLIPLLPDIPVWVVARLITGWSMAGLYMVIESWLNDRTNTDNRGLVLSVYTVLTLLAISLGQLMIGLELEYSRLAMLGAILLALGAIPVGLTRSTAPKPIPVAHFRLREVYSASHVAVVGALVGGLTTASYWVLGPIVASRLGLEGREISYFLVMAILGGAVLQLPVGRLSDRVDRRLVLAGLAGTGAVVTLLAMLFGNSTLLLYGVMFFYGGTTFPLYSISLAHANDNTSLSLIEVGSVILLVHSAGAVVGPVLTSLLLERTPMGMFAFGGFILFGFGLWSLWRSRVHPVAREHFEPFHDTPRTSHEVLEVAEQLYEEEPTPGTKSGQSP